MTCLHSAWPRNNYLQPNSPTQNYLFIKNSSLFSLSGNIIESLLSQYLLRFSCVKEWLFLFVGGQNLNDELHSFFYIHKIFIMTIVIDLKRTITIMLSFLRCYLLTSISFNLIIICDYLSSSII